MTEFLAARGRELEWPPTAREYENPHEVGVPQLGSVQHHVRAWITPRVSNYSQNSRVFKAVAHPDYAVSDTDVSSFTKFPMFPLNLAQFVEMHTRQQRELPTLSPEMSFTVDQHPWSKSYVAADIVERLRRDVAAYSSQENSGKVPQIKCLREIDIKHALSTRNRCGTAHNMDYPPK